MKETDFSKLNGSAADIQYLKELYANHEHMPYISPERDLALWLDKAAMSSGEAVPKRNMVKTPEGYLPGHMIILWRVQFGTYDNTTVISKYFEYDYGIDAKADIEDLIEDGLVMVMTAKESLTYMTAPLLKKWLKDKSVTVFSKMKKDELIEAVREAYTEEELAKKFTLRGYYLSEAGEKVLANNPAVIDKHPKKKY
ncbi:hypothetical protein ACTQ5J_06170 [Fundicoccus sp. Sow4_F4]|uniref:hypothetical protein n=1 Tax=Fundicoccus sp. Sow4_F4 TaxID=3438783 RepID=UPI003F911C9A